jgi:hypothetical protein
MLNWLFGRELKNVLEETKNVKAKGVRFKIKKVDVLSYLNGSKVLMQHFDTYKTKSTLPVQMDESAAKKIKEHFADVLVAGVVYPPLSHKKDEGKQCVHDLFIDWEMVTQLYNHIMLHTYGKKKLRHGL